MLYGIYRVYTMLNMYRFMIGTHDREKVAEYFNEHGGSIDHDNFFMPIEKLIGAPFTVYVVDQREGDFVLVPPLSPHQVINKVNKCVYGICVYIN